LYDPGEYDSEFEEIRDVQTLPFLDWWSSFSAVLCKSVQNEDIWRDDFLHASSLRLLNCIAI
jgi:hypothetical protein